MALITDILLACSDHLQHTGLDWDMTLTCWADEPSMEHNLTANIQGTLTSLTQQGIIFHFSHCVSVDRN